MSLLSYFKKVNSLPTAEETGVGEKATEEANKRVTEALRHKKGKRKRKATAHSEETRAKIGKFAAVTPENISQTVLPVNGDDPFDDISD